MTIEQLKSLYSTLQLLPTKLLRIDDRKVRIYFTYEKGYGEFFPGVTGMIEQTQPMNQHLIDWLIMMGDKAEPHVEERKNYGSMMHSAFAEILINKKFSLDTITKRVTDYISLNSVEADPLKWELELKKDILAFSQWIIEFEVIPLAIEIPLCSRKYKVATLVDLICKMTKPIKGFWGEKYKTGEKKGEAKETIKKENIFAIVDFKSRKKAYVTDGDELQLKLCEEIVKENFPEFKDINFYLYSWHPKDWKTSPGFFDTDHSNKHSIKEMELISALFHIRKDILKYTRLNIKGLIDLNSGDIVGNYIIQNLEEITKKEYSKIIKDEMLLRKKSLSTLYRYRKNKKYGENLILINKLIKEKLDKK